MKVLSLFDGISCGRLALEHAGIPVEEYHAFEIDKYAIQISKKNYPDIIHHGDVFDGDFSEFKGFDLLLGGSPCTFWSIAKKGRETTPNGIGGKLFIQYVRALKESGCKYFLYENNYSIHKNIKAFISEQLGVEPIMINSALLSAQNRKRCYWTNIPNVRQPKDKGIVLKDIIESRASIRYDRKNGIQQATDKAITLCASDWRGTNRNQIQNAIIEPYIKGAAIRGKYILSDSRNKKVDGGTYQSPEIRKDEKANTITTVNKDCMLCERIGTIEHGGNKSYDSKQWRVYSVRGKSVTLCGQGGGGGAKTGLYKIDLPDGDYIIRKLTPIEAERLQTLPDNYTEGISNTQRYKCIGNGWTVDVIAHILKNIQIESCAIGRDRNYL